MVFQMLHRLRDYRIAMYGLDPEVADPPPHISKRHRIYYFDQGAWQSCNTPAGSQTYMSYIPELENNQCIY